MPCTRRSRQDPAAPGMEVLEKIPAGDAPRCPGIFSQLISRLKGLLLKLCLMGTVALRQRSKVKGMSRAESVKMG